MELYDHRPFSVLNDFKSFSLVVIHGLKVHSLKVHYQDAFFLNVLFYSWLHWKLAATFVLTYTILGES